MIASSTYHELLKSHTTITNDNSKSESFLKAALAADRIAGLFERCGNSEYIGEPVSILEHSWQAYEQAKENKEKEECQVACLLHDIGHVIGLDLINTGLADKDEASDMAGCCTPNHEGLGGQYLRDLGFKNDVAYLVEQHVNAKRYLVYVYFCVFLEILEIWLYLCSIVVIFPLDYCITKP